MTNQLADGTIVRRRRCDGCNYRWYTKQPAEVQVSKYDLKWSASKHCTGKHVIAINDPI
jgi:transcriptional regulator NrdR family protein